MNSFYTIEDNDEIKSGDLQDYILSRRGDPSAINKLEGLINPMFKSKDLQLIEDNGNPIKELLKSQKQYYHNASVKKTLKILLLYGGSGSGKTTAFTNFVKNLDNAPGLYENYEIYYENENINFKKGDYHYDSPFNSNMSSIQDVYNHFNSQNKTNPINIRMYKNISSTFKQHFESTRVYKDEKIEKILTDFRLTKTKITDNNMESSRSHVIHYLLVHTKKENEEGENSILNKTLNMEDSFIDKSIKLENFYDDFCLYIIIDTMGFENIMNGLLGDKNMFVYMYDSNKIDGLEYDKDLVSDNIKNNIKEDIEQYLKLLGKEAAILLEILVTFINIPPIKKTYLRKFETQNIFYTLISDKYLNLDLKDVDFMSLLFFNKEIEKSQFIYEFYKKLTIFQNVKEFHNALLESVSKYDDGELYNHYYTKEDHN